MKIQQQIHKRINEFSDICRKHDVRALYLFGSSLTKSYDEKLSDIDFFVEIDESAPIQRGEKLMSFWDKLESFFDKKVDLLTEDSLKNPVLRKNIYKSRVLIYDGRRKKILV
ncbi:MAG: nucleotidyltransferase domain-containing protein [Bacteroidales bacterium]|nr:nucleotidyltransferase domain-containing protein [Bacteroidales bacterium]MCF8337640.1 nucleotidyltransferase domain-containing protein [Bacteroidales bacterium]